MGLLVNIIAADEDDIEAVGLADHPVDEWSGIEARDIDTEKLATLHCLLTGDDFEQSQGAYEPAFVAADEGVLVLRIPDEVAARLAELDEESLELVGAELAATEAFEEAGWSDADVQAFVIGLGDLARLAEAQGQVLLAWLHPLRT